MRRPSFQFYPGDWQANSNLRRCSHAEKGVWVDVMCLLHDQPEYGVLRWTAKEIAQAVGCNLAALKALVTKGVLKGDDLRLQEPFVYVPRHGRKDGDPVTLIGIQAGPIWYSSRMVKDEYVRTIRGESSRFGAEDGEASKATPKAAPKAPFGDGSSSSSSSSTSVKRESADALPRPEGVPEQVWKDWLKLRKAKKAPVTLTVLEGAQVEAGRAGMSLEAFLRIWCRRGSQGLEASWLKPEEKAAASDSIFEGAR